MYIYIAAFLGSLSNYISLPIFSTSVVLKFIVMVDIISKQVLAEFTTTLYSTVLENYTTFREVENSFLYLVFHVFTILISF